MTSKIDSAPSVAALSLIPACKYDHSLFHGQNTKPSTYMYKLVTMCAHPRKMEVWWK